VAVYQLFKLASEQFPKISGTTSQVAHQYFHTMSATVALSAAIAYSIKISKWVTGSGTTVANFATGQGLNSLSINGVLQQSGLYSVGATSVTITPSASMTLKKAYPITLLTYNAKAGVKVSAVPSSLIAIP
jgi:hypothetical protein